MKGHGNKKYRLYKTVFVEAEEETPLSGTLKPRCILDDNIKSNLKNRIYSVRYISVAQKWFSGNCLDFQVP